MHFDSFALKDLYFIDSQWLCDVFAHVVSPNCNGKLLDFLFCKPSCKNNTLIEQSGNID